MALMIYKHFHLFFWQLSSSCTWSYRMYYHQKRNTVSLENMVEQWNVKYNILHYPIYNVHPLWYFLLCRTTGQNSRFSSAQTNDLGINYTAPASWTKYQTWLLYIFVQEAHQCLLTPHGTSLPDTHSPVIHKSPRLEKQYWKVPAL